MDILRRFVSNLQPRKPLQRTNSLEHFHEEKIVHPKKNFNRPHSLDESSIHGTNFRKDKNNFSQQGSDWKRGILEDVAKLIRQGIREKDRIKIEKSLLDATAEEMRCICKKFCTGNPEKCLASSVIIDKLKSTILKSIENKSDIMHIWVGRQNQTSRGIDTVVLVTRTSKSFNLGDEIWGLKIIVRLFDTCSDEASSVLIHDINDSIGSLSIKLSDFELSSLFSKHSNITLINTSNVCSIGYNSNARIEMIPSIVIHCHIKGVIPTGEDAFPRRIGGHRVDVREAVCHFAVNPARISERIGTEGTERTGTLGGFVTLQNPERQAFLTCAHVVLPVDVLKNGETCVYARRREINVVDRNGMQFGKVHKAEFKHGQASEVSIDAALVEITDKYRYPCDGNFAPVFSSEQIMETGFSENNMPQFENGEMEQIKKFNFRKPVLKIGAKSGLTIGSLKIGRSSARIHDYEVEVGNNFSTTLYKQMEVIPQYDLSQTSDSREPFLDYGDSGSFVYFISQENPVVLKCIGLAVAKTSHGTCLMTPIDKVFEALDLPFNCLSKFVKKETQGERVSDLSAKLDYILKKMATKDDIQKIEGEISTLKEKFSATESNVKILLKRNVEEATPKEK
ncbi:uncharacterized protein LOC134269648 [Saccostrea cucullata]|uniref:uncharacterized protein LOC134269648 n=1 Tax=Saccostrea cuccullata TaxID=36930 RepID=UPI002ED588BE